MKAATEIYWQCHGSFTIHPGWARPGVSAPMRAITRSKDQSKMYPLLLFKDCERGGRGGSPARDRHWLGPDGQLRAQKSPASLVVRRGQLMVNQALVLGQAERFNRGDGQVANRQVVGALVGFHGVECGRAKLAVDRRGVARIGSKPTGRPRSCRASRSCRTALHAIRGCRRR